ncbi:OmpA family protein [Salinarimonas soli]|uniref:OmpA family protein n=1 Tax=Salinarimonas soli TaxID=1638099 RepID=A0A5B2VQX3_9HYPH|nr:OmpA family protein [Salinarimonas soli]
MPGTTAPGATVPGTTAPGTAVPPATTAPRPAAPGAAVPPATTAPGTSAPGTAAPSPTPGTTSPQSGTVAPAPGQQPGTITGPVNRGPLPPGQPPVTVNPAPGAQPGVITGPVLRGGAAVVPGLLRPTDPVEIERRRVETERFGGGITRGDANVDVRIDELRGLRRERVEEGGRRVIIEEPGNRVIVREGDRYIIRHDETDRFRRAYDNSDVRVERRGADEVTIVRRPNGVEIVTVRDEYGNLLRRVRREPAGQEVVIIENAPRDRRRTEFEEVVELPPARVTIPREKYVVEVERATQEDLVEAFTAPPVERVQRSYTLDEVRQSPALRERVRRVDVDTVTFASGSWRLDENQIGALTGLARAILTAIQRNPAEVFLIEGHTDAVGADVDNLTLSDRRAETVATILTERFNVPAENLTTQGYGEQYLKINTQGPERENRRVTMRRITPLLRGAQQQQ